MSRFKTTIPVDVQAFKRTLPKDGAIEGVAWDKRRQEVVITYDDPNVRTGFTFAIERNPRDPWPPKPTAPAPKTLDPPINVTKKAPKKAVKKSDA